MQHRKSHRVSSLVWNKSGLNIHLSRAFSQNRTALWREFTRWKGESTQAKLMSKEELETKRCEMKAQKEAVLSQKLGQLVQQWAGIIPRCAMAKI